MYSRYIGIDYSGAKTPISRLKGLQVFCATPNEDPIKVHPPNHIGWNWTRNEIAHWCSEQLQSNKPIIIGIDHAFSFPISYMNRYGIRDWGHFLEDFYHYWFTYNDNITVESLRKNNPRSGNQSEFRLTEIWTSSAKSVFQLDGPGQVGKSTHSGIPWLNFLRQDLQIREHVHFWPFDGFEVPPGKSVLAEVYPSIFRNRYAKNERNEHEQDAYSIAMWLKDMDNRGVLERYFDPPLKIKEREQVKLEGWILGVY